MVLSLVRTHRESLLAVLEAFIYDPLLQWVLLENRKDFTQLDNKVDDPTAGGNNTAAVVVTTAAPGPGQNGAVPEANGVPATTAHIDPHHRLAQVRGMFSSLKLAFSVCPICIDDIDIQTTFTSACAHRFYSDLLLFICLLTETYFEV